MTKPTRERGASAVEFALILPLLVFFIFGIIEFGFYVYNQQVITNASREGARAGIVFGDPPLTDGEISGIVGSYCQNRLITFGTPTQVTTIIVREGSGASGDDLTVQVQYQYQFLAIPRFVTGITGGIPLGTQTIMRME